MGVFSQQPRWIVLSVASGTCAALNGVFAKLTTTDLTSHWVTSLVEWTGFSYSRNIVELLTRVVFFSLNIILNGIMWTFFTKALAQSTSTTKVSILNTSSNFMITAVLGRMIFSESLPKLWFIGAILLVVGNVIIGRREEVDEADVTARGLVEGGQTLTTYHEINQGLDSEVNDKDDEIDILDLGSSDSDDSSGG
ncbi:hypothetical protein OnM2_024082 [Erysiphe neolycopersici]|uniref:EamA domain-containing protein n=1 Tax=Erysiphe neolycopersici TaxID=212602 RepID=A0A420I1P6_9PEZI|nr:hypothetical protein OnM2_024082 [Erysiphe neolycopersici]